MEKEKINWNKYSKEDRKFLIQLSIENRNFLTQVYLGLYSMLFAFSALLISIYSMYFSIVGSNKTSITIGCFILFLIILYWVFIPRYLKIIHPRIRNLNQQYQEIHKTLHPELFKGGYYY